MALSSNWVTHETHIGWEEVPFDKVIEGTLFEILFESMIDNLINEANGE